MKGNANEVEFAVSGTPRPKQSFRYSRRGGYLPARVTEWQQIVRVAAIQAMAGRAPFTGDVLVVLYFTLPDRRRRDLDNLSKAVLDACQSVVLEDDQQVVDLRITKEVDADAPGVRVFVRGLDDLSEHGDMCECDRCAPRCAVRGGKLWAVCPGLWECPKCE